MLAATGTTNRDVATGVNGLNQATSVGTASVSHDARGNVTGIGATSYSYTSENLLSAASNGTTLYYDGLGRLVEYDTDVSTRFMYDGAEITAAVDNPAGVVTRRYVRGPGADELLVEYGGAGTGDRRWVHADERGSVIAQSHVGGALLGINRYDEYGVPGAGNVGRFQYTGQAWLGELGLYHYKARMYAPSPTQGGRFMQADPIGYGDGMNLYGYVGGDPVNFTDPLGLCSFTRWGNFTQEPVGISGYGPKILVSTFVVQNSPCDASYGAGVGNGFGGVGGVSQSGEDIIVTATKPKPPRSKPGRVLRMPALRMRRATCEAIKRLGDVFLDSGKKGTSLAIDIGAVAMIAAPFTEGTSLGLLSTSSGLLIASGAATLTGDIINSSATGNFGSLITNQFTNMAKGALNSTSAKLIGEIVGSPLDEAILGANPYQCR